jgi:hypothetical protein
VEKAKFIGTQRDNEQLRTGSAVVLMWGLGQIYLYKAKQKQAKMHYPDGIMKTQEHYAGGFETLSFY